jgi:hypothetical protein
MPILNSLKAVKNSFLLVVLPIILSLFGTGLIKKLFSSVKLGVKKSSAPVFHHIQKMYSQLLDKVT